MSEEIPLFRIAWDGDDVKNAVDSITRGGFWANGPYVDEFEQRLADYHGVEHALVFNSGTSALIAALQAHGLGPGDEVIVPSFTFVATANAPKLVGAEPRFADIERDTYGLDPEAVESSITQDTAAIIPVHYAGNPCRIERLADIADDHELALVEDAAEAFGAKIGKQPVGTVGDSAILSFCQNKVITTGEGGALLTDRDDVAERATLVRSHGRSSNAYFEDAGSGEYVALGQNYRMADVVAAVGVAQMEKADDIVERRRTVARRYTQALRDVPHVEPPVEPTDRRHVYQLYTVTFDEAVDRDAVVKELADEAVQSKVYFEPVHLTAFYREAGGYEPGFLPVTEEIAERVVSLPMDPDMPPEMTDRVVSALNDAVEASV